MDVCESIGGEHSHTVTANNGKGMVGPHTILAFKHLTQFNRSVCMKTVDENKGLMVSWQRIGMGSCSHHTDIIPLNGIMDEKAHGKHSIDIPCYPTVAPPPPYPWLVG